ncbi:MAG: NAD-dependent epimerase/dehydratase family protein [Pseudorhodoplanes sp.]|nr:NAD-dependent epimerase/dehydratase family protein [Pseudorhodoplanes sp.]
MHRSLVTGGSGFIGQHLVAALLQRGDHVRILDQAPPRRLRPRCDFVRASITDRDAVPRAMDGVDEVYHLAGIPHLWTENVDDFDRVNGFGTAIVLSAARENGIRRVVHCSSETVLLSSLRSSDVIDESVIASDGHALGPYTHSKCLAEQAAAEAATAGLHVVIVNPTLPVGANDFGFTPPAAMLAHFVSQRFHIYLDSMLNVVDVRDVAAGMILAAQRGRSGERYILGGENMSLGQILSALDEITGRERIKMSIPGAVALGVSALAESFASWLSHRRPIATVEGVRLALRSARLDDSKARRELGYAPRPVRQALAEFVAWLAAAKERPSPATARSLPIR